MSMGPSGRAHGAKLYKCALTAVIITDSVFVPLGHELPFRHFRRSHKGIEGIEQLSHYFLSRNDKNTAPAGCAYLFVIISRQTHHEIILPAEADSTRYETRIRSEVQAKVARTARGWSLFRRPAINSKNGQDNCSYYL